MSYVDLATRKFSSEFSSFLDKWVIVRTTTGKEYQGKLLGYASPEHSVVLGDARDSEGKMYPRIVIYGHSVSEVILTEEPLDLGALAKRLESYFPHMVKYYPEAKLIMVDRVKVTEKGVEGGGLLAERVREVYEAFVKEWEEKKAKHE